MGKIKIRKGLCPNTDGNCTKAFNSEIQEIPENEPFKCTECQHDLEPINNGRKGSFNPMFIIAGCIVIGLIVAAIIIFSPGEEEIQEPVITDNEIPTDSLLVQQEALTGRTDTLVIKVEGLEQAQDSLPQEGESEIVELPLEEPIAAESVAVTEQSTSTTVQSTKTNTSTTSSTSSHKLSYGTWTGGWKNGQPHGTGTMTYSTSHTIDSRDSKGRVAQPGEYIVGEWDNGHLVQGRWFKKDGTKEAVIIGKAG